METIYQMKQGLLQVWKKRTANKDDLLIAMQDWCKQAEESGIRALADFSHSLKQYSTRIA